MGRASRKVHPTNVAGPEAARLSMLSTNVRLYSTLRPLVTTDAENPLVLPDLDDHFGAGSGVPKSGTCRHSTALSEAITAPFGASDLCHNHWFLAGGIANSVHASQTEEQEKAIAQRTLRSCSEVR